MVLDKVNRACEDNKSLRFIELCAGIGGFRVGIQSATATSKCVYCNEIDEFCEKTYQANFTEKFNEKDIFNISSSDIPPFDLLCAGFPCQPFSIAGGQDGFTDERGKIYFKISEIIGDCKPKVVFMENVSNLVRHNKGETFKYIITDLKNMNYSVFHEVIDSVKFGIPQSRPRVYIVAFNKDFYPSIKFSFPKGNGKRRTIRDIVESGDNSIPISTKWGTYIDLYTHKISIEDIGFEVPKTRKKIERMSKNCDVKDCVFQIRSSGIRAFSLDDVYPTFAVSNSGGGAMIPVLSKERRHFNLLEMKRLMGFPEDFKFPVSRTNSIKQLANAVCPPVITEIMNEIDRAMRS